MEAVTRIVVEHMADAAGATVASLSWSSTTTRWRSSGCAGGREGVETRWATYSLKLPRRRRRCRPRNRMLTSSRRRHEPRYPDLEAAARGCGPSPVCRFTWATRKIGVATMSFPGAPVSSPPAEVEFLSVMSDTCAQAIDRVRVTADAADRSAKILFLADASHLSRRAASTTRPPSPKVAQLAVPGSRTGARSRWTRTASCARSRSPTSTRFKVEEGRVSCSAATLADPESGDRGLPEPARSRAS